MLNKVLKIIPFAVFSILGFSFGSFVFFKVFYALAASRTIDADVLPSSNNSYGLGSATYQWDSINDVIYFNNNKTGFGLVPQGREIEINGGFRLNTSATKPSCTGSPPAVQQFLWFTQSASGTKDYFEFCGKNASDTYSWRTIY